MDPKTMDPETTVPETEVRDEFALDELDAFYVEVDASANELAALHRDRLQCRRGCASCCRDGLEVLALEAERIRRNHVSLLRESTAHSAGACAFLDAEGACRVYADRPYICRTQGLPLRWFEGGESSAPVERRDICPLNLEGAPLEELEDEVCWLIGPFEDRLLRLDVSYRGVGQVAPLERAPRVALRSLFGAAAESEPKDSR
jgi:Fe-S-cluster containining protein